MQRREFLAMSSLAKEAADVRFLNRKTGDHPFRVNDRSAVRPHIFLITLDMVSPDHYHPARLMHRQMELPAMRRIFGDSVFFSNAFTTAPLCAPARAALATGRYSYITANNERAHDGHETSLRASDAIFQEYLKATGYRTKHAGKGHLGTQKFMDAFDENDSAWDRWDPPIRQDEAYQLHLRRLGVKPQRYAREIRGLDQDRATPRNTFGGWIEQTGGRPFPLEAQYTHYLVERAIEKLDSALAQGGSAPVYLQLDIFDPHQPFSVPDGFAARERELRAAFDLPESYRAAAARDFRAAPDEPRIYDLYRRYWGLYRPETVADYRVAHALQMEVIDRALARLLCALDERGLYRDALFVLAADHGEMNARRAMVDKGVYLHPDVLRIPMAVKPPASWNVAPRQVEAPVSILDIAPTLLEVAGVAPSERLDGESLVPLLRGQAPERDRELLFECGWHVGVNYACAIQRWQRGGPHYLYAWNLASDVDELFDLASTDAVNLARKPELARTRRDMVQQMAAFLGRDPRWVCFSGNFRIDHYFDLRG